MSQAIDDAWAAWEAAGPEGNVTASTLLALINEAIRLEARGDSLNALWAGDTASLREVIADLEAQIEAQVDAPAAPVPVVLAPAPPADGGGA